MPRKKRDERLNLTIEETLKRQFEVVCTLKGLSMSDGAQEAIADWVQKNVSKELLDAIAKEPPKDPLASQDKPAKRRSKAGGEA